MRADKGMYRNCQFFKDKSKLNASLNLTINEEKIVS